MRTTGGNVGPPLASEVPPLAAGRPAQKAVLTRGQLALVGGMETDTRRNQELGADVLFRSLRLPLSRAASRQQGTRRR